MRLSGSPPWCAMGLAVLLSLGCNPNTSRPAFSPLPAATQAELELPVAAAVEVITAALIADSIPVSLVQSRDGYLETGWFLASDGTPTPARPLGVEIVRVRGWITPGRAGHTDIQVEAVYRPMADPSRMARDLERLVPAEHPVARRLEAAMARLVTEYGHPEQLATRPQPVEVPGYRRAETAPRPSRYHRQAGHDAGGSSTIPVRNAATGAVTSPVVPSDHQLLLDLLPRVSRTFAMGIRLLPVELSHAVSTAYLLCRIADTIEDDATLPAAVRRDLLLEYGGWLDGVGHDPTRLVAQFASSTGDDAALVRATGLVLTDFANLPAEVRAAIRPPVEEMCRGMASYVARAIESGRTPQPTDLDDLEAYCWYVAGTVGWMLTDLFRLSGTGWSEAGYDQMRQLSRSFGLGLQLTNVIRDMGEDHRRGATFVPADLCARVRCPAWELFTPGREAATAIVLATLTDRALVHLTAARDYTTLLPRRQLRIRLFCLVPLFLAAGTLSRISRKDAYRTGWVRIKLTRPVVRLTVILAALVAPSNTLIRLAFRWLAPFRSGGLCREGPDLSPYRSPQPRCLLRRSRDLPDRAAWGGASGNYRAAPGAGSVGGTDEYTPDSSRRRHRHAGGNVGPGVVVDLTRLDGAPLAVAADGRAHAGAAVTWAAIEAAARPSRLRILPDPSSGKWATVGGMIATNAGRAANHGSRAGPAMGGCRDHRHR